MFGYDVAMLRCYDFQKIVIIIGCRENCNLVDGRSKIK